MDATERTGPDPHRSAALRYLFTATERDYVGMYRQYLTAVVMGVYGGGWRLPGRPNRCGRENADTEGQFATRCHNIAVALMSQELDLSLVRPDGDEAREMRDRLLQRIETPKPPRALDEIRGDASAIVHEFVEGELEIGAAIERLKPLHEEMRARNVEPDLDEEIDD